MVIYSLMSIINHKAAGLAVLQHAMILQAATLVKTRTAIATRIKMSGLTRA